MNDLRNQAQPNPEPIRADAVNFVRIDANSEGQRLDNYLIRTLKGVPKSHLYRIVRSGEVRINGKRCDVKDRLNCGDEIRIPPIRMAAEANRGEYPVGTSDSARRFAMPILFEDDYLIAINKVAGVAVHGGSGVSFGVIEQLRMSRDAGVFLELVHRLDRETSGVLMIAKTRPALLALHAMLRDEEHSKPDKRYLCLVQGRVANDRQHIKAPLLKFVAPNNERRVRVDENDGQHSHTIFNVVKRFSDTTLLEAELKTGRTHQIRVHCAHIGHVIAGDDKYGDFAWNKALTKVTPPLKRMFLHAASLTIPHPISGERLSIQAPLPIELATYAEALS
jgi:23S rRNA pseudouridine955/2504/2580 synthase